jgi:hypothetical protein
MVTIKGLVFVVLGAVIAVIPVAAPADAQGACVSPPEGLIGYAPSVTGHAVTVDLQGDYAYVAEFSGVFQVFDVSDPCNPVRLPGHVTTSPVEIGDVDVHGNRAYLANDTNGLAVYDITDPASPTFVASRRDGTYLHDVHFDGAQYLYGGYIYSGGAEFVIYDVAASPIQLMSTYDVIGTRHAIHLDVVGTRAYVYSANGVPSLEILDVSDRVNPVQLGSLTHDYDTYGHFGRMEVRGDFAYVATAPSSVDGGLLIIDVSNETAPVVKGFASVPDAATVPWRGPGLDVDGDRAYLATTSGLRVFDVSDPAAPTEVKSYPYPASFLPSVGGDVVVRDYQAYVTSWKAGAGGLAVYQVLNVDAAIDQVADDVDALPGLDRGQRNSLLAKLSAALRQHSRGNSVASGNMLEAFLHETEALVKAGVLADADAAPIIAAVEEAIDAIGKGY